MPEFIFSEHDRPNDMKIIEPPTSEQEFYRIISANIEVLHLYGFARWGSYNACVEENISSAESDKSDMLNIPVYAIDDLADLLNDDKSVNPIGNETIDLSVDNKPLTKLPEDKIILLFPHEWFNVIPEGFEVIGLWGEKYKFSKELSKDRRFGCLAYGILK